MGVKIVRFKLSLLLLCFTTLFNILDHQRRFRYIAERENSNKFCSEALIWAWGSFTCRKSTSHDPTALLPSWRKSYSGILRSEKKIHRSQPGSNPSTSDPEMLTKKNCHILKNNNNHENKYENESGIYKLKCLSGSSYVGKT